MKYSTLSLTYIFAIIYCRNVLDLKPSFIWVYTDFLLFGQHLRRPTARELAKVSSDYQTESCRWRWRCRGRSLWDHLKRVVGW